jgi:hypothetical protein
MAVVTLSSERSLVDVNFLCRNDMSQFYAHSTADTRRYVDIIMHIGQQIFFCELELWWEELRPLSTYFGMICLVAWSMKAEDTSRSDLREFM